MRNRRRARLVLTILLLAAFTLITLDYRSSSLNGVRSTASTVFGPVENALSDVTHPIGSWFSSIGHLGSYKHENSALKKQVAELKAQLHLTAAEHAELTQEEQLLHLAGLGQYTVVGAQVIAYGSALNTEETATINRGSRNGIAIDQTVIDGDGLVGRTINVGRDTATILLANDPTFTVGARLEGKKLEIGGVKGGGRNQPMALQLYSNSAPLTVGEQLVSAGDSNDTPFVPEVPIGTITQVNPCNTCLAETAVVKPFVDYTAIDIVAVVIHAPKSIKRDSLLPAPPTPAPTVTVTVTATPGSPNPGSSGSTSGTNTTPGTTPDTTPTAGHS
jgi:rod shape-determining protein MreC